MEKSSLAKSMQAVRAACDRVAQQIQGEEKYGHTSHLTVQIAGSLIYDTHFTGPELADVYSVTKTVLATLVGVAQRERRMPPLDDPVSDVLSELRGTPAAARSEEHTSELQSHRDLHSFPTRRSSDLIGDARGRGPAGASDATARRSGERRAQRVARHTGGC